MTPTLYIPDIHGDFHAALHLLRGVGVLDDLNRRVIGPDEMRVVQLGDIIHGSKCTREDDSVALALVEDGLIDTMLIGNHEYPFLGGVPFGDYTYDADFRLRLKALEADGRLVPALAHDDILVTHAGLTPDWITVYEWTSARHAAAGINAEWKCNPDAPLFKRIGSARGGFVPHGGVLWSDWEEPRWLGFSQINGHSIGPIDIKRAKDGSGNWALRLDTGGGKNTSLPLAAAIVDDDDVQAFYDDVVSLDQLALDDYATALASS